MSSYAGDGIHTFEDEAKIWQEYLYSLYQTDTHLMSVTSADDFKDKWNEIGFSGVSVDGIVLIFHGSVTDGENGGVGYMYVNNKNDRIVARHDASVDDNNVNITQLSTLSMKQLIFSSCNSGNPDVYNTAYAFMLNNRISGDVIAWDGGTIFNYEKKELEAGAPGSNQHTWEKYVGKEVYYKYGFLPMLRPVRERIGKRVLNDLY